MIVANLNSDLVELQELAEVMAEAVKHLGARRYFVQVFVAVAVVVDVP